MKINFWLFLFILMGISSLSQSQATTNQRLEDEKAIRANIISYVHSFKNQDARTLASFWTEDATYIDPESGKKIQGRQAIEKEFATMFQELGAADLQLTVDSIEFQGENHAIEKGSAQVNSPGRPPSTSKYIAKHVKKNGKWLIESSSERPTENSSPQNKLIGQLGWLIGHWIDEDENIQVETSCRWILNNQFISCAFRVIYHHQQELEGVQIIGWDPITQSIRSTIYDSDGSVGKAVWTQEGSKWFANITSKFSNGSTATSVIVYSPIDHNSYKISISERKIDGKALPNIEEVSVTRKRTNLKEGLL